MILFVLPSENHPFKSRKNIFLNSKQLKFDYETVTSLQPHQRSKNELNIT